MRRHPWAWFSQRSRHRVRNEPGASASGHFLSTPEHWAFDRQWLWFTQRSIPRAVRVDVATEHDDLLSSLSHDDALRQVGQSWRRRSPVSTAPPVFVLIVRWNAIGALTAPADCESNSDASPEIAIPLAPRNPGRETGGHHVIAAPRAHVLMSQFICACRPQESGSSISLIPFTRGQLHGSARPDTSTRPHAHPGLRLCER